MNKKTTLYSYPHGNNHNNAAQSDEDANEIPHQSAKTKNIKLANTYKMAPEKNAMFHQELVKQTMQEVLQDKISDMNYDAEKCRFLTLELATEIKNRVKQFGFDRYKLVSQVSINSMHGQDLRVVSRFIWDERFDNYVSCTYRNATLSVVAVLFGVYQE